MLTIIIAAISKNQVIGSKGKIPWNYPKDQQRFKRLTMGHPVIMGRKTVESLRRPLSGRQNLVLTRRVAYAVPDGVLVYPSLEKAKTHCAAIKADKIYIIGGTENYPLALPSTDILELTHIPNEVEGDAFFPAWNEDEWELVDSSAEGELCYCTYRRKG